MKRNEFDPGTPVPPPVSERPTCGWCGVRRRPQIWTKHRYHPATSHYEIISRVWDGKYLGYGHFCSTKCCDRFANAAFNQGMRRRKA